MISELKELTSALTTPEMQREIQELKKECAGYAERLRNIKAATNHVTPEEKEQVSRSRWGEAAPWGGGCQAQRVSAVGVQRPAEVLQGVEEAEADGKFLGVSRSACKAEAWATGLPG